MLRLLFRTGVRRGVLGGSRAWTYTAVGAGLLRLFIRAARKREEVVYSEPLEPGQALLITHPTREATARMKLGGAKMEG